MSSRFGLALLLVASLLGCPGPEAATDTPAGTDGGGGGMDGGGMDAGATDTGGPVDSFSVQFGPVTVAPGLERTQCVVVRLGNPSAFHVGSIRNVISDGSHHFIVYRTSDTVEQTTPFDCTPFVDTFDPMAGSPLMITQVPDETLTLPSGVGFSFEANQMIRLEMHYINTTAASLEVQGTSTFTSIPDAAFRDEADFLFIGTIDIDLPPRAATTVGPVYFPMPTEFSDANFFGLTGHTHRLGTNVEIYTSDAATGGTDTPVYVVDGWRWEEPLNARFDPPFMVPPGGGFRFQCDYQNTTDTAVSFGESANNEMCFFWAYYYPSHGARVCVHTDQLGGVDICCPSNPTICNLLQMGF